MPSLHRARRPRARGSIWSSAALAALALSSCGGGGDEAVATGLTSTDAAPTTTSPTLPPTTTTTPPDPWASGQVRFTTADDYQFEIKFSIDEPWLTSTPDDPGFIDLTIGMQGEASVSNELDRPSPSLEGLSFQFWYATDACAALQGPTTRPGAIEGRPVCLIGGAGPGPEVSEVRIRPVGTVSGWIDGTITVGQRVPETRQALVESLLARSPDYVSIQVGNTAFGQVCNDDFMFGNTVAVLTNHGTSLPADSYRNGDGPLGIGSGPECAMSFYDNWWQL
jgi:hypothetical protein